MKNQPASENFIRWFDPRFKQPGSWGYILNRITGLGLTLYLVLHLFMLSKLVQGPAAYDTFIALAKTPLVKIGEMFVIAAGFIHGLNGIRIGLNSFGVGVRAQKALLILFMALAVAGTLFFGWKMFAE